MALFHPVKRSVGGTPHQNRTASYLAAPQVIDKAGTGRRLQTPGDRLHHLIGNKSELHIWQDLIESLKLRHYSWTA